MLNQGALGSNTRRHTHGLLERNRPTLTATGVSRQVARYTLPYDPRPTDLTKVSSSQCTSHCCTAAGRRSRVLLGAPSLPRPDAEGAVGLEGVAELRS